MLGRILRQDPGSGRTLRGWMATPALRPGAAPVLPRGLRGRLVASLLPLSELHFLLFLFYKIATPQTKEGNSIALGGPLDCTKCEECVWRGALVTESGPQCVLTSVPAVEGRVLGCVTYTRRGCVICRWTQLAVCASSTAAWGRRVALVCMRVLQGVQGAGPWGSWRSLHKGRDTGGQMGGVLR